MSGRFPCPSLSSRSPSRRPQVSTRRISTGFQRMGLGSFFLGLSGLGRFPLFWGLFFLGEPIKGPDEVEVLLEAREGSEELMRGDIDLFLQVAWRLLADPPGLRLGRNPNASLLLRPSQASRCG